jgi:short-subunit dehydrogenase
MSADLKNRFGPTALITGASDGIGRAFAEALAARGVDLVLIARRETVLLGLARDLAERHGVTVEVIGTDLSAPGAVADILTRTADQPIGLLVASAGFGSIGPFLSLDAGSEANMVDVNCRSVVELTHGLATRMAARGRGGVVLFSSVVGFSGAPFSATYAATKGFVQSFAEGLAVELRPSGISVLAVAPGPVGTGFAARAGMQMGKAETPETVARIALRALSTGGTVRPGFLAKLLGWSLAALPRWGRARVMGQIMKGMTSKAKG